MKMNEKVIRLRSSTLTVGNLSMIFKLDANQVNIICCEEEGEIILPTESGIFNAEDFTKTYVVNGEPIQLAPSRSSAEPFSTCNSMGIPLPHQKTVPMRTNLNTPLGQISSTQTLLRPSFTSGSRKVSHTASWKKSLLVGNVVPSASVNEKFQVRLSLIEETASVDQ